MKSITSYVLSIALLVVFLSHQTGYAQSNQELGEPISYEVDHIKKIYNAIKILESSQIDLRNYDLILISGLDEEQYQITFTTSVIFAEDGPVRGRTVKMIFNSATEKIVGFGMLK